MGHRLSKITTRTGDDGTTGLADGTRADKDSIRIEAIGDVDELNSALGLLLAESLPPEITAALDEIQHELFDLGAELAVPGSMVLQEQQVKFLERKIEELNRDLPPLKEFVLPRGGRAAALGHVARSACRRAERSLVRLSRGEQVNPVAVVYLNRLSDLLFICARRLAREQSGQEAQWRGSGSA
jgi:cob(I)alamin adenosyltransferase